MKLEFFHDVICSFCYPMSYRMRQLQEKYPDLEIVHRSFALVKEEADFDRMFGNRDKAKQEILQHWQAANQNDDLHRFNIEGMRSQEFPFPGSMPALRAVKAAEMIGGHSLAWDVFDALQKALFTDSKNVEDLQTIEEIVSGLGVDLDRWKKLYEDNLTLNGVNEDLELAQNYGRQGVPFIVIDGAYGINGAQSLSHIEATINEINNIAKPLTIIDSKEDTEACSINDEGTWSCD